MPKLNTTLHEYDYGMLVIIANRWDVDLNSHQPQDAADQLAQAMLEPERAAHEWSRLSDKERGALQILLGAQGHKMTLAKYARLYGDIRLMGEEKRQREKPHLNQVGMAEVLYYRGLLSVMYDEGVTGTEQFVFVPPDLAAVLPTHEAGYDLSEPADAPAADHGKTQTLSKADTSLVDDLTTLVAYCQVNEVQRKGLSLPENDYLALEDFLVGIIQEARLALTIALALELKLLADDEDSFLKPVPQSVRQWLDQPRTTQVQGLVEAWQQTHHFVELWFAPNLVYESGDIDPTRARKVIQQFLQQTKTEDWVALGDFISRIKKHEPDFQRPGADYQSWYLRDRETGDYLRGFESWDAVEGVVLQIALTGPMHWLGLLDIGESDVGGMIRLNAYGRAFAGQGDYPTRQDPDARLEIESDGIIRASRHLSRYDRFQLARFTDWGMPGEVYEYKITAQSLERAQLRGIRAEHVEPFLKRTAQGHIPESIQKMMELWAKTGGATAYLSQVTLLETATPEELDGFLDIPELRRFFGKRIGDTAVIVRAGQWQPLMDALSQHGILVDNLIS